ncbi:conserved hypothetical protein [Trichinella spiralis]|uniref:hypothetical protein n=1 Tax=Trichinella spiralis TaxID=6334 RepID=UPI0001EFB392|nr:conserved hypothetical protein [Trichinella spiralis]
MMRMKRSCSWPSMSDQKPCLSMKSKSEEIRTNSASALYKTDRKQFAEKDKREIEISSGSSDDDPTLYRARETSGLFDANSYFLNSIRPLWCNTKTHGSQTQKASSAPAAVSKSSDDSSGKLSTTSYILRFYSSPHLCMCRIFQRRTAFKTSMQRRREKNCGRHLRHASQGEVEADEGNLVSHY